MNKNYGFAFEAYMCMGTETDSAIDARVNDLKMRAGQLDAYPGADKKFQVMQHIYQRGSDKQSFNKVVRSLEISNQFEN